jgi:peroxiredoxin Q/BCP
MSLETGAPAPDFTLPTDGGGSITLSALRGQPVVLYFYPKDDTPGCTTESCDFRDAELDFSNLGVKIIGISKDSVASHDRFKAKHGLTFPLASDTDGRVCDTYGVWVEKKNYGKTYMGIERTTVLIGRDGSVVKVWRKVKVAGHVASVMEAAKEA